MVAIRGHRFPEANMMELPSSPGIVLLADQLMLLRGLFADPMLPVFGRQAFAESVAALLGHGLIQAEGERYALTKLGRAVIEFCDEVRFHSPAYIPTDDLAKLR